MLTEYHPHEIGTVKESSLWKALKFGTSGEVNSQEGCAIPEGLLVAPPNCSEVGALQVELNEAKGEALVQQPPVQ